MLVVALDFARRKLGKMARPCLWPCCSADVTGSRANRAPGQWAGDGGRLHYLLLRPKTSTWKTGTLHCTWAGARRFGVPWLLVSRAQPKRWRVWRCSEPPGALSGGGRRALARHGAHVPDGAGDGTFDPDVMLVVLGLAVLLEFLPEA